MLDDSYQLRQVPVSALAEKSPPISIIKTDDDLEIWKKTQSYQDYAIFLRRLNESVVGVPLPWNAEHASESINKIIALLDTLDSWIDMIPPLVTPQRFGNLAFRSWGKRLDECSEDLLKTLLPPNFSAAIPLVKPYLMDSFGSFIRMDYGTGHETAFALFLLCLSLIRFFKPIQEEERELVLTVFLRYLRLCWRLQDVYKLEPAGSHGVWGLDDYCFLPYIFGSAQLRDQTEIPVSAVVKPPLSPTNLYFMAIMRIHEVKQGPFHEHSSQLYSIAMGVPHWRKVNSGLFKMYEAEVLGKRVVVQHILLGGLLEWNDDVSTSDVLPPTLPQGTVTSTPAPWASLPRPYPSERERPDTALPSLATPGGSSTEFRTPSLGQASNRTSTRFSPAQYREIDKPPL